MNKEQLKEILPHREPMLLLDECDERGGSYKIKGDEFFLQGHFPGKPIVPGVILCEIMAQSVCVVLQKELEGRVPYFVGIDKVKFRSSVLPGDTFNTEVTITKQRDPFYFMDIKGFVDGKLCVEGSFSCAALKKDF